MQACHVVKIERISLPLGRQRCRRIKSEYRQPPPLSAISGREPVVRAAAPWRKGCGRRSGGLGAARSRQADRRSHQALDVFDFEPVMKKNVPPAHFGYMATGVDDEMTLARQSRGFPEIRAAAAAAGRCQQDRHERRDFRREIRQPDRDRADRQQPRLSSRCARSPSPRRRRPATICKFCRRSRRPRSRTRSPRAARRSGSSSTPRNAGRSPKRW